MEIKILIIGGSGFIGTNLIEYYSKKTIDILNIDNKPPQNTAHYQYWNEVDIRDFELFFRVVSNFNPIYILHMAARADLTGKNLEDYSSNIIGVKNLIKIANTVLSVRKVIFASTMLVCKAGYIPKNDLDYCPPNLYGESKVVGEKLVREASDLNFNWVIVRPSSIWGPWFGATYRGFFEVIVKKIYFNFSRKMCTKTYGYIGNVIYQINELLLSNESNGQTYYLGDYRPTDIKEWANEIALEIGYKPISVPHHFVLILAIFGDILKKFNIHFPLSSFRLHNMTTDNVLPLENTAAIAPNLPFNRKNANRITLQWMKKHPIK